MVMNRGHGHRNFSQMRLLSHNVKDMADGCLPRWLKSAGKIA
jgi:hypothetical protein